MDYAKKPSVFILGERKKDAPPDQVMTKEEVQQHFDELKRFLHGDEKRN